MSAYRTGAVLPPELVTTIITYLRMRHSRGYQGKLDIDLRSMALVCRAWREPSQSALFHSITIDDPKSLQALGSSVCESPAAGGYVHFLRLSFDYFRKGPWDVGLQLLGTRLVCLRHLKLYKMAYAELGEVTQAALLEVVRPLKRLEADECNFPDMPSLLGLLCASSGLETVDITTTTLEANEEDLLEVSDSSRRYPDFPPLVHLRVSFSSMAVLALVEYLVERSVALNLQTLVLRGGRYADRERAVYRLLADNTKRCSTLEVSPDARSVRVSGNQSISFPSLFPHAYDTPFLSLALPPFPEVYDAEASEQRAKWFRDVLSTICSPAFAQLGPRDWDHPNFRRMLVSPKLSMLQTVHACVDLDPNGDRIVPAASVPGEGRIETLGELRRNEALRKLGGFNAQPTYGVSFAQSNLFLSRRQ